MKRGSLLEVLTYLSVAAVLMMLWRSGLLRPLAVRDWLSASISIVLLFAGFLATAQAWRAALAGSVSEVRFADAVASTGLSVFGKYLPGKIWLIAGMAGYISRWYGVALKQCTAAASRLQVVSLLVGFAIGAPVLNALKVPIPALVVPIALCALVVSVLSIAPLRRACEVKSVLFARAAAYLWPGDSAMPKTAIAWLIVTWICYGVGFALLAKALVPVALSWQLCVAFPLAAVIGLLVLIAPGGIGAREGTLALVLVGFGLSSEQIASIAVASRLWFLLGEGGLFLTAMLVSRRPS